MVAVCVLAAGLAFSSCGAEATGPRVATPTFSPPAGAHAGPVSVTISTSTPDAAIHFTTDGSTPTAGSPTYTTPIHVENPSTLKAVAQLASWADSAVAVAAYDFTDLALWLPLSTPGCLPTGSALGHRGEAVTFTRASVGTIVQGGVERSCPPGRLRVGDAGALIESKAAQAVGTPTSPGTETRPLEVADYHARVEGAGALTLEAAGAIVTGLPCTATAGSPCAFRVSGAGNVTWTVTPPLTFAQVENRSYPTSRMLVPGLRDNDKASVATPPTLESGSLKWTPTFSSSQGTAAERSMLTSGAGAFWLYYGAGTQQVKLKWSVTSASHPVVFSAGTTHEIGWSVRNGTACVFFDGIRSCTADAGTMAPASRLFLGAGNEGANFFGGAHLKDVKIGRPPVVTRNPRSIAGLGDSLTRALACSTSWLRGVALTKGDGWISGDFGIGGLTTADMLTHCRGPADVATNGWNHVTVLGGTNDVNSGVAAATAWANLLAIWREVKAAGFNVIALTVPPTSALVGQEVTEWQTLNGLIRSNAAAEGVTLVDIEPGLNDGANALKAVYRSGDGVHWNQAGCDFVAAQVAAVIP